MDVVTLFAANAIILVVMAGGFFAASRTQSDEPWWSSWIAANLALATGLVIFAFLPVSAAQANAVPHCLLVLGFGLRWRAAQLFVRGRSAWFPALAPAGATALLFALPAALSPGFVYAAVNVVLAAQTAAIAWQFWQRKEYSLPSSYGLILAYCVMALSFASRTVYGAAFLNQFSSYLPHDRMLQLHLVVAVIHATASGAFALSLAYERVVIRHRHAALRDGLTHLPNRTLFNEQLRQALEHARTTDAKVGLLHLDLDHFKRVNDAFGHDAGDELLRTFAARLRKAVRSDDIVARLGGDEFALILPNIGGARDLSALAGTLLDRMREPFDYSGRVLDCRTSIGASLSPQHGITPEELLKNADIALYIAKSAGRGNFVVFEHAMRSEMQTRSTMTARARNAIENDRIFPHYQPKVDILNDNSVVGFEALLRWRDSTGSVQNPGAIKAAFEDIELASAISDRMLDRVLNDMCQWLKDGIGFGHVAVNAAAVDFCNDDFAERVLERLTRAGVPAKYFQVEITEGTIIDRDTEHVHRALDLLSRSGVKIALDDFGTGYASLRHMKRFPVGIVKVDKSFVDGMVLSPEDRAIIQALVTLGDSMGIEVVAEGIETAAQHTELQRLGCKFGQGFLYAKPLPASSIPALVEQKLPLWAAA